MIIGDRLRALREEKKLSQGDVEKRTGLLRCYISRVENGHTVPAIETLEKMARALEVPLYQLFYEGEEPPQLPNLLKRKSSEDIAWGSSGKDGRYLNKLRRLLGKADEEHRKLVMYMTQKMARPASTAEGSFEQTLVEVWRQALVKNADAVELGTKRYPVRKTPKRRLRQVDFVFNGKEVRGLEQNPETKSRWAQMARSGKKVMQFLSKGRYVANVVDGKMNFYGRGPRTSR